MVNEYTPDAHNVRAAWIETGIGSEDALIAEFDRWLAGIKADAWDEGYDAGSADQSDAYWLAGVSDDTPNPYLEDRHVDQ